MNSSNQAYTVDTSGVVALVGSDGKKTTKSSQGQALDVSYGADGTLWVLTPDPGREDSGGNLMAYLDPGTSNWVTVQMKNGKEAVAVSGDKDGHVWYVDGDERKIWWGDKQGNATDQSGGNSNFMAVSTELETQIWAISRIANPKLGNPVMYRSIDSDQWQTSDKSGGVNLSGFYVVNNQGQVVRIAPDKPLQSLSPTDFATDVSVSSSGQVWIVSVDPYDGIGGGVVLKIWDTKGDGAENWASVPDLGACKVSAV